MKPCQPDLYITPTELAENLGITVQGLYKFLKENNIATFNSKTRRHKIYPESMRRILALKELNIPRGVIVTHIVKGGVGKTLLTHALASRASAYGLKTLMIDLDQQANLTTSFGIYSSPQRDSTLLDVYESQKKQRGESIQVSDLVVKITDDLHILPTNMRIANLDMVLVYDPTTDMATLFENLLEPIRNNYDLVFFDCPPSLSRVTAAAHLYADKVIMPVNVDRFSIDGLDLSFDHMLNLQKNHKKESEIHIVLNKFDTRQKLLGNKIISQLGQEKYADYLCEGYVSQSKQLDNSIAEHECVWNTKKSRGAALEDLANIFCEIFEIDEWKNSQKKQEIEKVPALYSNNSNLNHEVSTNV